MNLAAAAEFKLQLGPSEGSPESGEVSLSACIMPCYDSANPWHVCPWWLHLVVLNCKPVGTAEGLLGER